MTSWKVGNQSKLHCVVRRSNVQYVQLNNMQKHRYVPLNVLFKSVFFCPGLLSTIGLHVVFITVSALNETVL